MQVIISQRKSDFIFTHSTIRGPLKIPFKNGRAVVCDRDAAIVLALGMPSKYYVSGGCTADILSPGKSVLLKRDMGLGDVIMTTPLCRHLSSMGIIVDFQTSAWYKPLFDHNPYVRNVYAFEDSPPEDYAATIDLRMMVETAESQGRYEHRIKAFGHFMDVEIEDMRTDYFPTVGEIIWATSKVDATNAVAFIWGASCGTRSLTPDRNVAVINSLVDKGILCVILSERSQAVPIRPGVLDLTGKTSIRESAAIIASCDVTLTPDTGAFHLAGALDRPTVAYFGTHPIAERQAHNTLIVLDNRAVCPLFPCRKYSCLHFAKKDVVPCLDLDTETIVSGVLEMLGRI